MKHQVKPIEFRGYIAKETLARSVGAGSNKALIVETDIETLKACFVVLQEKRRVYVTESIELAINRYNELD